MRQRRYTEEAKALLVSQFLAQREAYGISLRAFAGINGIPYYTMRDMYRDPRFNQKWKDRYCFSTQDNPAAGRIIRNRAEIGPVRIDQEEMLAPARKKREKDLMGQEGCLVRIG